LVEIELRGRPRVLFVAGDVPWPPDGGGRIATLRNLQTFTSFCDVDLIALADPVGDLDLKELQRLCRSVTVVHHPFTFGRHKGRQLAEATRSVFSRWPYRLTKFRSRAFRSALARLRADAAYDLVHFDQFGVAQYRDMPTATTYACQNVESDVYRLAVESARTPLARLWSRMEAFKLRSAERRLLPGFDEVFILAPEDGVILRALGVRRTRLIPMPAPPIRQTRVSPPAEPTILSLGSMSWFGVEDGLLWFHSEVYPRIRAAIPDVRWMLVGPNAGAAIRRLDGVDGISVRGYVSDLAPVFDAARVAIIPLHIGGGIRMKFLDLMAAGVPTVSTSVGARGLTFADGEGGFRRDDPAGFGELVTTLLRDDDRWRATTERGRSYIQTNHTTGLLAASIRAGVDDVLGRRATAEAGR
jgi:glycosyltransferase involved in cell wall biosynthesis